ncbi:ABC transporter permease [Collinsella sp. An7]|nr:ABC transporter permease [Collinsella sp. An7]
MACEAGASRPSVVRGRGLKVSVTALSRAWRRVPAPLRVLVRLTVLLLAVSLVTFALVSASPIDPVQANVGQTAYLTMSPERRAALAERWGAGEGVLERWAAWLVDALHGDLGYSLRFNAPVVDVVAERLAGSALLLATAWLLSGALGLALGVLAGARRGSRLDRIVCGWCYLLSATPTFWLAMLALMVFSVWLGWFPVGFASAIGGTGAVSFAERLHHAALPALVLSLTGVANVALHTREKTLEVMEADYVRFARSRGESERSIVVRHGLRNLVLPALTLQCAQVSEIIGGSVLVEQVFSYPGLGQAAVTAGLGGDAPLLVGIALATALLVFAGNLAANLLYGVVDPRLRAGEVHHG